MISITIKVDDNLFLSSQGHRLVLETTTMTYLLVYPDGGVCSSLSLGQLVQQCDISFDFELTTKPTECKVWNRRAGDRNEQTA